MLVLGPLEEFLVLMRSQLISIRFFSGARRWAGPYRDSYAYTHLLKQCGGTKCLKEVHAQIITSGFGQNQFLAANLVSKYNEYNVSGMEEARKVFDSVLERDVLLWNVVIRGYANSGPFLEAVSIYDRLRSSGTYANRYTYPFVLKACAAMGDGIKGHVIHGNIVKVGLESDLFVGNALVAFYAKCCETEEARKIFDEIIQKDIVSWNSMISGYTQNDCMNQALTLFHQMLRDDNVCVPDHATFVGILPSCAKAVAIQEGIWVHGYIIKSGMKIDVTLGSSLIAMYANCGRLETAHDIFHRLSERNIVVWNAMVRGYGMHSHANEALEMFSRMVESGIHPDAISFLCVLSACSHGGFVDKGWEILAKMKDYGVEKSDEHYACMVDLLGRAGRLDQAVEFIKSMPVKAGKDVYGALLGACRIHNNIELAEEIAERLFVLDPNHAGRYILLAKMYEDVGRWKDAANLRKVMREKQIRKPLGCSAIEVDCVVHTFGVEDKSHPLKVQIFDTLEQLEMVMEEMEDGMSLLVIEVG